MDTLDDTMLAARWARAVLVADARTAAICEVVAERRGTTIGALVAASQSQQRQSGQRKKGQSPARSNRYAERRPRSGKGYNPNRKKKGEKGGGQFTTADDSAGSGGGGGGGKSAKDAEKAAKEAERNRENMWKIAEDERAAKQKAEEDGNYGPWLRFAEKMEAARRKARDLAETDEERAQAEQDLEAAAAYLDDVKGKAAKAKADKETAKETKKAGEKAEREAESARKKTEREAETERKRVERETARETARVAEYAAIAKNYPDWEAEVRKQYEGRDLSDAELNELILRDRARRCPCPTSAPEMTMTDTLTAAVWDADLHPRGHDGKFIETFGIVKLLGGKGGGGRFGKSDLTGKRGEVVAINPDPKTPGRPNIRVRMTDDKGREFEIDVKPDLIEQAPEKARLDTPLGQRQNREVGELGFDELAREADSADPARAEAAKAEQKRRGEELHAMTAEQLQARLDQRKAEGLDWRSDESHQIVQIRNAKQSQEGRQKRAAEEAANPELAEQRRGEQADKQAAAKKALIDLADSPDVREAVRLQDVQGRFGGSYVRDVNDAVVALRTADSSNIGSRADDLVRALERLRDDLRSQSGAPGSTIGITSRHGIEFTSDRIKIQNLDRAIREARDRAMAAKVLRSSITDIDLLARWVNELSADEPNPTIIAACEALAEQRGLEPDRRLPGDDRRQPAPQASSSGGVRPGPPPTREGRQVHRIGRHRHAVRPGQHTGRTRLERLPGAARPSRTDHPGPG